MKVSELITQLTGCDPNMEVRIMNTSIDEDENCPTFELNCIESASDLVSHAEAERLDPDTDCVILEYSDDLHIMDAYKLTYNPLPSECIHGFLDDKFCDEKNKCQMCLGK